LTIQSRPDFERIEMKIEQSPLFRRPVTYPEIAAAKAEMSVKRAVDAGKVKQVKFNYYYVQGWWEKTSTWNTRDALTYLALAFGKRVVPGREEVVPEVDSSPSLLRREARFIRKVSEVTGGIADELDRRAELLEVENTETEATD
jgi:hypothetical protein